MFNAEEEAMQDELGAEAGDPRRCPRHPGVASSSPDGMFDGVCGHCEGEMADDAERWDNDPENPHRGSCGTRTVWIHAMYGQREAFGECVPDPICF